MKGARCRVQEKGLEYKCKSSLNRVPLAVEHATWQTTLSFPCFFFAPLYYYLLQEKARSLSIPTYNLALEHISTFLARDHSGFNISIGFGGCAGERRVAR